MSYKETLCLTCKTSTPTCPWVYNFTPVKGWDAEKTKIRAAHGEEVVDSYIVKSCPLYEKNTRDKKEEVCTAAKYAAYNLYEKKRRMKNEQS